MTKPQPEWDISTHETGDYLEIKVVHVATGRVARRKVTQFIKKEIEGMKQDLLAQAARPDPHAGFPCLS